MSSAPYGLFFSLSVTCNKCRGAVPVNGFTEALPCPGCGQPVDVPAGWWMDFFDEETRTEVLAMETGEGRQMSTLGGTSATGVLGHRMPRCQGCKTDPPTDRFDRLAADGGYTCGCGRHIAVREAPVMARMVVPGARWLVDEHLTGDGDGTRGAAAPVLFSCMGCGGSLSVDGSERAVSCGYCGASNFLPDALWQRMHPVPTIEPFFVVAHPTESGRPPTEELSQEQFEAMAAGDHSAGRALVAASPSAPAELLRSMLDDEDYEIRAALASNPALAADDVRRLARDDDDDVREAVAARTDLPSDVLSLLIADSDWEVRRAAVCNPKAETADLIALAGRESDSDVLEALGKVPGLDPGVLWELSRSSDYHARVAAATHAATSAEVLVRLSRDDDRDVLEALSKRLDLPAGVLVRLSRNDSSSVAEAARENPDYPLAKKQYTHRLLVVGLPVATGVIVLLAVAAVLAWKLGYLAL